MKKIIIAFAIIVIGISFYFLLNTLRKSAELNQNQNTTTSVGEKNKTEEAQPKEQKKTEQVIGKSVQGRDITAYYYGSGDREILFILGIHGGYAWNTALLAYNIMDYLKENPNAIPDNIRVAVIPALNPDGLSKVVGTTGRFSTTDVSSSQDVQVSGRFNGNLVDINRNFDCNWKKTGIWQNKSVSGGNSPFSEPESSAVRDYVKDHKPTAVVAWYSAAGGVFSSNCNNGILPETQVITDIFAKASGYLAYESFDFYELSGDMTNWLAKDKIPAISILLSNHKDIEWDNNLAGIKALFEYYAGK